MPVRLVQPSAGCGNPAGVVLSAEGLDQQAMLRIAADVGCSERAFLAARDSGPGGALRVRYFSPESEVDFCGHATIATGVALADADNAGQLAATFESPPAGAETLLREQRDHLLSTLRWTQADLDPRFPPMVATAGNRHPVLVVFHLSRLTDLDYDFQALGALCP